MATATCEVVVGMQMLCGKEAKFLYRGIQNQQHGRTVLRKCMYHARETFIRMEPALRDGEAKMRCLVQTRLTVHCKSCGSIFRFEPLPPTVHKMPGKFCPNCGHTTIAFFDPALDYWEIMASELPGDLTPQLTAELHSYWVKDAKTEQQFVEYIKSISAELTDD